MIENLLHAQIVLSKKNVRALKLRKIDYVPSEVGIVTFLGSVNDEGTMVNLLIRFNAVGFDTLASIHLIEAVLERRVVALNGNDSVNSAPRILATVHLDKNVRNPSAYLRSLGIKVADEWTRQILANRGAGSSAYW